MVDPSPQIYMGMGLTAEEVYRKYNVSREDQDQFSYRSHQNALKRKPKAASTTRSCRSKSIDSQWKWRNPHQDGLQKDEGPRADTSLEALAKLRRLSRAGTVTAGNSSQTSDGAAAAIVMSRKSRASWA
jgi:acetyl-CoA acyltransferase